LLQIAPSAQESVLAFVLFAAFTLWLSTSPTFAADAAEYTVETFIRGLDTPWAIDFAPDGRVFLSERPGRIRVVERGKLRPEPWMIINVTASGESGLLGQGALYSDKQS
jgi:glucose/arabinose dehydrogenase